MAVRARVTRCLIAGGIATTLTLTVIGTGWATPPPSNPSDSDLGSSRADVAAKAAEVGDLANQLSAAEVKLAQLRDQVEQKMEEANKALVDLQTARDAADRARADADAAKADAQAAGGAVDAARRRLDEFAAASYQQGSTVGSVSALVDASSPENLLARVQLLDAISGSELSTLADLQRANVDKANQESVSRKALATATQKQQEADAAKAKVDAAMAAAAAARREEAKQVEQLSTSKTDVESQLSAAQDKVNDLQTQRQRYQDWAAQKARDDAAAEAAAQQQAVAAPPQRPAVPSAGAARAAIAVARAMAQLGVAYAWGGGTAYGPSRGISDDGGDADFYGDYNKIGFDCSGLMVYAFAGVGVSLPHYSGYQYYAGQHVPLSQIQPGDMLFYGTPSNIHHVTMYIGDGRMIEAPYSGSVVRVVPVRWGEIMPYATRVV
ncbi:MAG: C40 family peptidase [Kutzneria sp.]|nr:C40 family peptidase [Kutzneria sp.]MBV9843678.1 C40 family peptidase [Kutzneria sp.]